MGYAGRLWIDAQRSGPAQNGYAEVMDALRVAAANLGLPFDSTRSATRAGINAVLIYTGISRWR